MIDEQCEIQQLKDPLFWVGLHPNCFYIYIMANYATLRDGEVTEGSIMTHTQLAA